MKVETDDNKFGFGVPQQILGFWVNRRNVEHLNKGSEGDSSLALVVRRWSVRGGRHGEFGFEFVLTDVFGCAFYGVKLDCGESRNGSVFRRVLVCSMQEQM